MRTWAADNAETKTRATDNADNADLKTRAADDTDNADLRARAADGPQVNADKADPRPGPQMTQTNAMSAHITFPIRLPKSNRFLARILSDVETRAAV